MIRRSGIALVGVLALIALGIIGFRIQSNSFRVSDLDLGVVEPESRMEADLKVENFTGQERKVLGMKAGCTCIASGGFPVAVGAGETRSIGFSIGTPKAGETFEIPLVLYVDSPGIARQTVWVRGSTKR